jgi:hypothetical protein
LTCGEASDDSKAGDRRTEATMTDDELRCQVAAELSWDPRVDSEAVEVYADSGTVTLRGTVASLRQNRATSKAAARVRGVIRVANELRVRIPDRDQRDDDDLRGDVLEALMLDGSVPMTVDAQALGRARSRSGRSLVRAWRYRGRRPYPCRDAP